MNTETTKQEWTKVKGKIKSRFSKLSDETVDSLKGNLDNLSSKLQSAYGYAKEQADREFQSFKATLSEGSESRDSKEDSSEDRQSGSRDTRNSAGQESRMAGGQESRNSGNQDTSKHSGGQESRNVA